MEQYKYNVGDKFACKKTYGTHFTFSQIYEIIEITQHPYRIFFRDNSGFKWGFKIKGPNGKDEVIYLWEYFTSDWTLRREKLLRIGQNE